MCKYLSKPCTNCRHYEDIPPGCVRRGVLPHPAPAPQPAAAGAGRDGPLRVRRGDAG